ncbi:hypothetical protein SISNIDRAFT_479080 [Sistotremastrum niveocremeum HHB9708]|uniref:Heme oxygenase-like protein n=1 Tax=Sistotremastrum niveocremeum HHB9708 TaxID=1314777 RepID=A0A164T9W9_9AGAM|nr:hypothetical protein SISNIDRAFT_479080 [Sistotremastrum niveocremeum HHB9708]
MSSSITDWTATIATLLRDGTAVAHEKAEKSEGASWLTRGELDKEEYARFLIMLWYIYSTLEEGLDRHSSNPVLAPTYNAPLLSRAAALEADIRHILQTSDWKTHPIHREIETSPPPALTAYVSRLKAINESSPELLLSHAYVRYLGDLSGGQYIRRSIAKAYGFDSAGTDFYDFGSQAATMGDLRKIKVWYRDGMNEGVPIGDIPLKESLVNEASLAFVLNGDLFKTLRPPTNPPSLRVDPVSATPVAHPGSTSPTTPSLASPSLSLRSASLSRQSSFSFATILTLVLAASLAHFILTVGGIKGEDVLRKLFSLV